MWRGVWTGRRRLFLAGAIASLLAFPCQAAAVPQLLGSWGGPGSGPGQFDDPFGIAVGPDGSVYVADTENHRIQQFTAAGAFIRQWGSEGMASGQFSRPTGIETDASGDVFVVELGGMRVQRFDPTGAFEAKWGSFGLEPGELSFPLDIGVDPAGDVYVPDLGNRVQKFDRDGGPITEWGTGGDGPGEFDEPWGVVATSAGVYVVDTKNHRVQRFTPGGLFDTQFGSLGPGPGEFTNPTGIDAGPGGEIAVFDLVGQPVAIFDSSLSLVGELGAGTIGAGSSDVAYSPSGDLFVTDVENDRILRFGEPLPGPPAPVAGPSADTTAPALRILGRRLTLNRRGLLRARLRCPSSEPSGPCTGVLKLRPRKKIEGRRPVLARGGYKIAPGKIRKIALRTKRRGRALLRAYTAVRRVEAFTRVADAAGNRRLVAKPMTVRVPR